MERLHIGFRDPFRSRNALKTSAFSKGYLDVDVVVLDVDVSANNGK